TRHRVIEAAEQCERMDIPAIHPIQKLDKLLAGWQHGPIFAGLERSDAKILNDALVPDGDCAALVGPVGGWTDAEREILGSMKDVIPVSLGPNVLRSETAVAAMLARLAHK
ncbi:MAG: RNA methyltransferase, partial [Alphaproteobacteria bacterium]|nr:RNA methyltransferase [Alphaproteobacteria bacterium]